MPFSYATPGSGPSAGGIGWFNFGNLSLTPGSSVTGLTGTLNDGTTVTFDLAYNSVSGALRTLNAVPTPTYSGTFFGNGNYTNIPGNVALYTSDIPAPSSVNIILSNIVVLDSGGNPVPNYTAILADAESTGVSESWTYTTNGGNWNLFATLGNSTNPTLTGVGTPTVSFTGNDPANNQNDYVFTTQNPTLLNLNTATTSSGGGQEAVAIGFATTRVQLQKNIGARIVPADQFVLNIAGTPASQATTAGAATGIQTQEASVFGIPGNTYTLSESMAPGSGSTLSQYTQVLSSANATPGGSIPPSGNLPISFTPALGDDVTYTVLNAAPELFTKTVDKAFADINEVLTYTVTINNPNNFAVSNVVMTDATPGGTTYIGNLTVSAPFTGTDPATGITITSIPANSSVTVSWQVQVGNTPPTPNPITNVANISVPGGTSGSTNVVTTQISHAAVSTMKMVDKAFAAPGDILNYTLTLNNLGNTSANNVVVTDAIPAGTTFVPGSVTGATGTPPTLTLNNPIPVAGTATVTFQVLVGNTVPNPNPVLNSATSAFTYTVDPANPNGANGNSNSNTVTTLVNEARLAIVKSAAPSAIDYNGIITYTLVVQNTGNVAANNVVLTDAVPSGTTFVPGSVTGATGTPPTLTLANPIPAGGTATVTFQVQAGNTPPNPNPIPNSATAAFTYTTNPANPDGATGTAASNTVTTPVAHAAINLVKAVDKAFAEPGDLLTYTLTLQNTGNTAANNVVLTDAVPAGTTFIPGSVTGATGTPPTLTLINPIPAGGISTVTFQVLVGNAIPTPNPIPNNAAAAFTYTVDPLNPNGASGTSASNTVTTLVAIAAVTTTKTVDQAFAQPGDTLTYTLTLKNTGSVAANQVVITDPIPAGTTFIPASLTGATGTPPTLTLTAPIAAGGTSTVTYQVKVGSGVPNPNPLSNTANAAFTYTVDPAKPNGRGGSSASNTVNTEVNLAKLNITKSVDKTISYLGDIITYKLALTNTGNVPADNVVITDTVPNGTSYVPGSLTVSVPSTGTPATGIALTNPVAPGQIIAISFQIKVTAMPLPNPIVNKAPVAYTYTVNPAAPNGVSAVTVSNAVNTVVFRYNYSQQITDITQSVALEQAALAAIINEEGAKIQKLVAMGNITAQELLCVNKSVADMLDSITMLENILRQKLKVVGCQIDATDAGCN